MQAPSQGETIQFRIPGDPKYVSPIRRAIRSIARSLGFPEEFAQDIEMSVAEALANAVEHGSPGHKRNAVVITCKVGEDSLTIDVRDEGPGFEPLGVGEACNLLEEQGRGLRMIYQLMDRVKVRRTPKGSRIRMVKSKRLAQETVRANTPR